MLRRLTDTLVSSLLGMGVLVVGFWLLYLAFLNANALQGIGGGALVLLAMWLITRARKPSRGQGP